MFFLRTNQIYLFMLIFQTPKKVAITVTVSGVPVEAEVEIVNNTVKVPIKINGSHIRIEVPIRKLKEGLKMKVEGVEVGIQEQKGDDDLHNYVRNYMQWYFILLQLMMLSEKETWPEPISS